MAPSVLAMDEPSAPCPSAPPREGEVQTSRFCTPKAILLLTLFLFNAPVVVDLALSPPGQTFRYFAADAFYYFVVGRNIANTGMISFDQAYPTNGFHPLWQFLVALLYKGSEWLRLGDTGFFYLVIAANLLLISLGLCWVAAAIQRSRGRLSPLFLFVPVGLYAVLVAPAWLRYLLFGSLNAQNAVEGAQPLYGTLWSYVNGMESAPLLCSLGLCAYSHVRLPWRTLLAAAWLYGLALSLLCLSRLDHSLLACSIVAAYGVVALATRNRRLLRSVAVMGAAIAGTLGLYMLGNLAYCGSALPVSGLQKSTFPVANREAATAISNLISKPQSLEWLYTFWRVAQMALPMAFALAFLGDFSARWARFWRARRAGRTTPLAPDQYDSFLAATALFVLAFGAYNFLFVLFIEVGHWYFPVSTLFVSLAGLSWCDRWRRLERLSSTRLFPLVAALAVAFHGLFFAHLQRMAGYHETLIQFYFRDARHVREFYGDKPVKFVAFDDGITALALPYPTVSGMGLAADPEAVEALRRQEFLHLALARGYDRMTSATYFFCEPSSRQADGTRPPPKVTIPPAFLANGKGLQIVPECYDADGRYVVFRVTSPTGAVSNAAAESQPAS
ncbi:MAG: hypothetical protein NTW86_04210 [Candidatus Sumerlaeota bacterium]|nr:hypothetical protein [Candidatus Sumerlaeota bacterium]